MEPSRAALEMELAWRLLPIARRWRRLADRALAGFGLSVAPGWALVHTARMGDDVRQGDLAQSLEISGASLVRLIDQLEGAGLIERRTDRADRRANLVRLTPDGRRLAGRIEETLAAIRARLLEGVSDDRLADANAVMAALDSHILAALEEGA
ncbi:MAG TPA: MarR family transcriptional regulator [Sphingomonas sp.]|nr:MarR family transcriptional regulator [Sphingomonas sp.]